MSARIETLFNGATANGNSPTSSLTTRGIRGMYGVAQANITGTATVTLYGRLSSAYAWKVVHTFSGSDAVEIVLFPEMYAAITGYSSGAVTVGINGGL